MYSHTMQLQQQPPLPPPPHSPNSGGTMRRSNGRGGTRRSKRISSKPLEKSSPADVRKASTGRLYMAPQATIRNTNHAAPHHSQYSGGVVLGDFGMNSTGISTSGNTRRRRRGSGTNGGIDTSNRIMADSPPTMVERQDSEGSLGAMAAVLVADREGGIRQLPHAPILWSDDPIVGDLQSLTAPSPARMKRSHKKSDCSPPEMNAYRYRTSPMANGKKRINSGNNTQRVQLDYGNEDYSESLDDSFRGCDHNPSDQSMEKSSTGNSNKNSTAAWSPLWWYLRFNMMFKGKGKSSSIFTFNHCLQISILLILAISVFDSHAKVQSHKDQLRQYDEERAHILEQMMWIDRAAKKVHKKYSEKEALDSILQSDGSDTSADVKYEELASRTKRDLMKIQHTIQLNARDHLASTFGGSPAQVSLQITDDDKLLIGLSDDTPHAISTLVQQVNRHFWDDIDISVSSDRLVVNLIPKLRRSDEISPDGSPVLSTSAAPWLEFVERSHGCRTLGSVALRQESPNSSEDNASNEEEEEEEDNGDQTYLVLSVYLEDHDQSLPQGSVCIGQVLQGFDALVDLQHLQNKY